MSDSSLNHNEYLEQIAAYVTGGLEAGERAAFVAHLATCESCSAALADATQADRSLVDLFSGARPAVGFEDRVIQSLRLAPASRMMLHPAVWRAASGLAAALILGSVGYSANRLIEINKLPFAETIAFVAEPGIHTRYVTDSASAMLGDSYGESVVGAGLSAGNILSRPKLGRVSDFDVTLNKARKNAEGRPPTDSLAGGRAIALGELNADVKSRALGREYFSESKGLKPQQQTLGGLGYKVPALNTYDFGMEAKLHGEVATRGFGNMHWDLATNGAGNKPASSEGFYRAAGNEPAKGKDLGMSAGFVVADGRVGKPLLTGTESRAGEADFFKPTTLALGIRDGAEGDSKKELKQVDEMRVVEAEAKLDSAAVAEGGQQKSFPQSRIGGGDLNARSLLVDTAEGEKLERLPTAPVPEQLALKTGRSQVSLPVNADAAGVPVQAENPNTQTPPVQPAMSRKIVRNGDMEFEVDSFDSAYVQISRIVIEEGGYVSSTNSEKLPNGKVRGTVAVRVPPDRLDTLVLKLRALGDLKSQKISAQDVTKQYFDLEGELKAARAMEERVLNIIKSGKGEIKDLLAAETQLGVYREKIEKLEGEIRYYNNLISLSTLSITAYERDIRTPAFASLTEQVGMGIESEDVEKSRLDALKAIEEAKGRLLESNLKKFDAGQLAATIRCEVSPDAAGPLIDRLRQLGRVARLDIDRKQTTPEGVAAAPGARVEKKDTRFSISLYNLANIAARQTTNMNMAVPSVEDSYKSILDSVKARKGRIITSSLNRQKPDQTTATISFEVAAADADAVLVEIRRDREMMMLTVTENPDTNNVTAAKRGFSVQLFSLASVAPRETEQVVLASKTGVGAALQKLLAEVKKAEGRIMVSQLNEQDPSNVSGSLDIEVMRAKELDIRQALSAAGDIISRNVNRSTDADNTVDSKVRLQIRLVGFEQLPPLETTRLSVEVSDVDKASSDLRSAIAAAGGRVIDFRHTDDHAGQVTTHVLADMPLAQAPAIISQLKNMGKTATEFSRNPQAPAGEVARAQIDVTIASVTQIVGRDQGLSAALKSALSTSVFGLLWSVRLIVIGLLFAGPWALLLWGGWKFLRRAPAKTPA